MPLRQDENDEMDSDMKHEDALPCDRTYTDPYYLDQHILTDHNTVKTYVPKLQVHSDNMYPPKKRAMYDYMRQNSIEQHSGELKHVNDTVEKQYVDKPGYNVTKLPIKQDTMSRLEQCQRQRSDSLKSVLSLSSDSSSTVSSYSRDRSSYTIPEIRDHHTPERNSMVDRLGHNSDISKPLFPSSDSENSDEEDNLCMEDNSGNNFTFHKTNLQGSVIYKNLHENHSYTFHKHIPEPMTNNIGENSTTCTANSDTDTSKAVVQNTQQVHEVHVMSNTDHSINSAKLSISGTRHTNTVANSSISYDPQTNFMGPMVSLLDRFNTADVPKGLDQKSKFHLDNKSIQRQCNDPVALNMIKSDTHMDSKSVPHTPLTDISKHFTQRQNSETAALNMIKSDNHMDSKSVPQTPLTDISKHFTQRQNSEPAALNMIKSDNHVVNEIYKCSLCDREFRQSGNFLNHMKTHSNVTCRCKCGLCDQEFDTSDGLQLHMRSHHTGANPYKCQHCDREFSQYNNLRRHVRMHREKIYKCKLCDREFNEEFYLTMHMGTHTGHRVYSCGVCNAGFQSSHDLKTHVKTHSPSQLHVCTVCGKAFSKACVLRQHKKAHSGERPHKCTECTKTFIHRHHLTMHLRSHTSAKPYTCEYCNKEFSQSSHLYKHVRQHAEEDSKENVGGVPPQQDLILPNSNIGHVSMVKGNNNYTKPVLQNKSDSTLVENNHNQTKYLISLAPNDAKMSIAHDMKPVNQTKRRRLSAAENTASSANQFNVKTIPITPVPNLYPNLLPQFLPPVSPITHLPPHLAMMFGATPRPVTNLPSFEQMYQQYASQFHTYYNTYLMTYMSQAAMLGQGHLPPLQGHHQGQSAPQLHLTEQQLQGHIYQGHSVPQVHSTNDQKHSESISTKTHKNQEQTTCSALTRSQEDRKSDHVEQPTRTEIAHELLKMATPVHHDHHNHDNTREHCNTTEHHNVTERQHVPEDHDITEGLKGDSHKTSSDKEHVSVRLSNNADNVTDSYRTPHQPLIQGNDYSVSCVTNDDESPALNLSQNHKDTSRHSKYVQKIHQLNHTAKDNGTSRSYMFNHCDGLSSPSVVTQSHPVTVPLPSSLACDKTGHFHINKLMSGENSHTHVTASSHRTQKEAKFLDLSRESPAGHTCMSPEITTYGHSSGVISSHANHAIMDSSSPVVHSTNSLLSFSQAFSVPKASYQSENVKNQTEYSNLPGFRTVSKADSLNREKQQNGSAQTRVSMEKTTGAHLATVNTPRLYLPMEGNQSIPHSEVETNVNNSEVVKAVNDTLSYESSAYLEMSSDEAAPEDCRSPMNQPEPDTGEAMADVDNVSEMDTDNEGSSNNEGSFELQTNESDNVKVKQKEGSFELQASESDDIKDLRRKITEIKNIIEAGIHGEISDEETEYTEMDTRDNTEKCEGSLKELETEISSVTDTLADSTAVEKEVGYTEMEQMDNRKSNMREMCVDSTEHSLGCTDSHEGNTNRIYNGLKDKKCEISLHKSQNGVELTINVETVASIPNVDRNALSKHAIDMRMPVDNKVNVSTEHALDCRTHNECKLCQRKVNRPFDLQCHMLMKHKEHFGSNHGNNGDSKNRDTDKHDHDDEGEKPDLNKTPTSQIKAPKTVIQMTHSEKSNENKAINIGIRCKYCNKMSGGERSYCDHVQTHSVQKPFICAICSRDFAHKHNLNRHMMSHNAKNHPCDECGRSFKEKYYLQMHKKIHAKEKIRDCEICGREVLKSEFWGHMNTHLGGILENPTYDQIGERVKELVYELNLEKKNATKWRANKNDSQETDQEMRSVLKVGKVHLLTAKDVNKNEMENISFERDHGKENIQIASNMKIRSRLSPVSDRNIPLDFKLDNRRVIQQSKVLKEKVLVIRSNAEAANMDLVESVPDSTTN